MGAQEQSEIHVIEVGEGSRPVLLLHGLNESVEGYLPVIRQLSPRFHIYAMDFRGHGLSPWKAPYRIQEYASDVTSLIESKIGEPVILAGHSLGGLVAAFVASRSPEVVLGLLLEDPPMYLAQMPLIKETPFFPLFTEVRRMLLEHHDSGGTAETLRERIGKWRVGEESSPTMLEQFGGDYVSRLALELHRTDPRTLGAPLNGTLFDGFDPDESLPEIDCPARLIAGSVAKGGGMRGEDINRVASLIPECSKVVWSNVGHDIHTLHPSEYSQEVISFIDKLPALA